MTAHLLTSESVTEGHADKICDAIADAILDAYLEHDRRLREGGAGSEEEEAPAAASAATGSVRAGSEGTDPARADHAATGAAPPSHVACEALAKGSVVVLAGEITSSAPITRERREEIVRETVREIGYVDPETPFHADGLEVTQHITEQASEIREAVEHEGGAGPPGEAAGSREPAEEQGAGDQGMMIGYATDETPELMPLPILLAHRLTMGLAEDRKAGAADLLRPDGKSQVSVLYRDGRPERVARVLVSAQHAPGTDRDVLEGYVRDRLLPRALGDWHDPEVVLTVNPSGSFVEGGPGADCGLTGRKIIVDTYGGAARHGGGAFSGKDPSKVDRSGAYYCRLVARRVVEEGLARRAEVSVSYAIGVAEPFSIDVETFGTGDAEAALAFVRSDAFDFRPAAIIERLGLLEPIYRKTTNYGHFGRPGLPWED